MPNPHAGPRRRPPPFAAAVAFPKAADPDPTKWQPEPERKLGRASRLRNRGEDGAREGGKENNHDPIHSAPLPPELTTDRGGDDGEGAVVAGRVAAPPVPRPRHDPRRRPPGGLLGPAVRAQGLAPRRRRRPRGAAPADAARVALRAQRSLPGLLPPGTVPFASSAHSCLHLFFFLVARLMFCSLAVADGRATPGNCRIRLRILFVCCSWRRRRRRTTPRARWSSSSSSSSSPRLRLRLRPQLTRTRGTRRSART